MLFCIFFKLIQNLSGSDGLKNRKKSIYYHSLTFSFLFKRKWEIFCNCFASRIRPIFQILMVLNCCHIYYPQEHKTV